jgi:hypothetical protein
MSRERFGVRRARRVQTLVGLVSGVLVLLVWGCQNQASDPQPDFPEDAIIEPETIEVFFDEDAPPPEETGTSELRTQALVGQPSRLLPPMRQGLDVANQMIRPALVTLNNIAHNHEPVLRTPNRFLWEVADEGALIMLVLWRERDEPAQWNYTLSIRRADEAASLSRTLFEGFFRPGPRVDDVRRPGRTRQTGIGVVRYQYDAISRLDSEVVRGTGSVAFRTGPFRRQISILLFSFSPSPDVDPINSRYEYDLVDNGAGSFQFILHGDIFDDAPGLETLKQTAIWRPDHSGRGRAQVTGDSFPGPVRLDECWGGEGLQVWTRWNPLPADQVNDGDENRCPSEFVGLDLPLPNDAAVGGAEEPAIP